MKKLCLILAIICFLLQCSVCLAEGLDLSAMSLEEILDLQNAIKDELNSREDYLGPLHWPSSALAAIIPVPDCETGKIAFDNEDGFAIRVGNYDDEKFYTYMETCITMGFTEDYRRGDDFYYAYDEYGNYLTLRFEGIDTMLIRVDAPSK